MVDGLAALKHQTPEQKKAYDANFDLIFNHKQDDQRRGIEDESSRVSS